MRIPRWTIVLSAGALAVLAAAVPGGLVVVQRELERARQSPSPTPSQTPRGSPPADEHLQRLLDPNRDLEERRRALHEVARAAPTAAPLARALRRLSPGSPREREVRAWTLEALGRYPADPIAREALVVVAFSRGGIASERALALDVLGRRADLESCRKPLEALREDPDPGVRERARRLLTALSPGGPPPAPLPSR